MCSYCEEERVILDKDVINPAMLQWCVPIKDASGLFDHEYVLSLFIDRGYLRLVDLEDSQCLDHGQKIKISYCPFCGDKLCH